MSIRIRLVLSYIAMIIVPVLLFLLLLLVMVLFYIGDFIQLANYYNIERNQGALEQYYNQRVLLNNDLKHSSTLDPEKLLDSQYLSATEPQLERMRMGIVVEKNYQIVHTSPSLSYADLTSVLAPFAEEVYAQNYFNSEDFESINVSLHDMTYSLTLYKLHFSDQETGILYILEDVTPLVQLAEQFPWTLAIALILSFIIPSGFLTYIVSRSIIKPLRKLQSAAEQIKEGNLEFALPTSHRGELGELSKAFEEMRVQLKHSIELRLKEEEARKELISNISHDLKTPITAIRGYIEGIQDGVANDPQKLNKYINTIHTKSKDLDHLINELFLYAKLDVNGVPFHFETFTLLPFLEDCAEECSFDLEKHRITLQWNPSGIDESLLIKADREKLKRVILNIIENSKNFADKSPAYIRMNVEKRESFISIIIADNGVGIDEKSLPYIFERFYRVDKSRNSAQGGSGLGLAIAKQIVEAHNGSIHANSKLGEGTTITITLPTENVNGVERA